MEKNKIFKKIDKHDVISFDVFDTLIKRNVNAPKQIFCLLEKEYNNYKNIDNSDIKNHRIKAEYIINSENPTIYQIYDNMKEYYSVSDLNWLLKKEIELEKKYCVVNEKIKLIYDYAISSNKIIYAISDMYLTSEIITELLDLNGYNIENLIVSCEKKSTKKSSKLFKYIKEMKIKKILHIGDSYKADYFGAKLAGINAIKIKKKHYMNENDNLEKIIEVSDKCESGLSNDYFLKLGINILAGSLLSFSIWLNKKLITNDIKKIFFLAREGKIFKNIYDKMKENSIETSYLCISRKSITIANFRYTGFIELAEILKYFTIKKNSTVEETFIYLNLELCSSMIFNLKEKIINYKNDKQFVSYFIKILLIESDRSNRMTLEYFKQENLNGKFAICDIGWNGTMQKCIKSFLNNNKIEHELYGYYFTLFSDLDNGYSFIKKEDDIYNSIQDNPILLENLFQCVDGSTIGYVEKNNKIVAIKKEIEFDKYTIDSIMSIDLGILTLLENWCLYGYYNLESKFREKNLKQLNEFINNPKKQDIKNFSKFKFSDITSSKIISSSVNIKKGLIDSGWKYAYLKKMFKVKMNYQFVIRKLKGR